MSNPPPCDDPGLLWCCITIHQSADRFGSESGKGKPTTRPILVWVHRPLPGLGGETTHFLPRRHISVLQRWMVPETFSTTMGSPLSSHSGRPSDGGHRSKSTFHLHPQAIVLEEIRGWLSISPTTWPGTSIPPPLEFHWALNQIHNWGRVLRNHCFLGHNGNQTWQWFLIYHRVLQENSYRPLCRLFIPPPTCPQGCSDTDPANQSRQDLHLPAWQRCGEGAYLQSPGVQRLPQNCDPPTLETIPHFCPTFITRHAQSYHHTTICPSFAIPGAAQRPRPSGEESRSSLLDPWGTCIRAYIGQTGQTLNQLLKRHKGAPTSDNVAQSAITEHAMEEMHVIDWHRLWRVIHTTHNDAHCRRGTSGRRETI